MRRAIERALWRLGYMRRDLAIAGQIDWREGEQPFVSLTVPTPTGERWLWGWVDNRLIARSEAVPFDPPAKFPHVFATTLASSQRETYSEARARLRQVDDERELRPPTPAELAIKLARRS